MKVTLKKAHRHNDVPHPAGAKIDIPLHDALFLKRRDVISDGLDTISAEIKKLSPKDQDAYKDALDAAAAAEAARKADKAPDNVTPIKS